MNASTQTWLEWLMLALGLGLVGLFLTEPAPKAPDAVAGLALLALGARGLAGPTALATRAARRASRLGAAALERARPLLFGRG